MNRTQTLLAAVAALIVIVIACNPTLPPVVSEDAGHESFARQAVSIVQGRKIKGYDEVKLLSDLAALTGREIVLRALMQQPDYVSHWSEVLVDDLKVHREGGRAQTSCYGPPLRAGAVTGSLADSVKSGAPATAINPDFNMSDLLASSLKRDNLYSAYSAHLFAMENRPGFDTEQTRRDTLGSTFGQTYVRREMLCLTCHNSEYSLSGEESAWDRTWPITGYFERALYGSPSGEPTEEANAMFRTDAIGGVGAIEPWGLTNCGTFKQVLPNDPLGEVANFAGLSGSQIGIFNVRSGFASGYNGLDSDGLQRTLPPGVAATCQFCADNCAGATLDVAAVANSATNAATVKTLLTNTVWSGGSKCIDCHGGSAGLNLSTGNDWANELIGITATETFSGMAIKRVEPGNANNSYLIKKLENAAGITPSRMPLGADPLTVAQINQIKVWINSMPALSACNVCAVTDCAQPRRHVAGNEAFAFLTAANITDNIWAEAMGTPLTIANYFPRNSSEQQALWHLTEYRFIPEGWSAQAVLARALTSNYFNRKAPQFSTLASPYVVPPLLDPWIVVDPRVPPVALPGWVQGGPPPTPDPAYSDAAHPENHLNAMGEGVYRYGARNLLNSIHVALDWPTPLRFPPANGYANDDLQRAIGQYFTDTSPGFRGTDLQGLLFWESVHGACAKPAGVGVDWIDRVVTAIGAFPPGDPGGPLSVQDVVTVMRDWLLGNGGVSSAAPVDLTGSEAAALASYFGVASLADPVSSVTDVASRLRGYCGVLVETPQFMLAGIAPSGLGPKPRFRVCNGGACSYQQICTELTPAVNSQLDSSTLICGPDSVNILPEIKPPDEIWVDWCIGPGCGLLVDFIPKGCFRDVFQGINSGGQPGVPGALHSVQTEAPDATRPGVQPKAGMTTRAAAAVSLSCPVEPPACDVRCSRIDCCGGPAPPLAKRGQRPLVLAWAEGAQVTEAEGVQLRPLGGERFERLKPGTSLRFGDLLALPVGARLAFKGELASLQTPRGGVPKTIPNGLLFVSVTGEQAIEPDVVVGKRPKLPLDHIRRIQKGWGSHGEGGTPLTYEQFKSYVYPASELPVDKPREQPKPEKEQGPEQNQQTPPSPSPD
jgi:hypothetical protein